MKKEYIPECKYCLEVMVLRVNKQSKKTFWGCSNFPKCKFSKSAKRKKKKEIEVKSDWGVGMINKRGEYRQG
jgi:ssDNA-binding Zn-finger/Zn-ribbon topoisomerase 1